MAVAKMAQNTLEKKIREKLNREVERLRYATKNMTHKEGSWHPERRKVYEIYEQITNF